MSNKDTLEVLAGGTNIEVQLRDGTTETVFVKKIAMRHMNKMGRAWGKEDEEIKLYVAGEKADDWFDALPDEAWEAIIETGRKLNEVPFGRWFARQQQAMKAVGVNLDKVMAEAVSSGLQQPTSS